MAFWGCGPLWPYPDTNAMNLNWVIKTVGDLAKQWEDIDQYITDQINKIVPGVVQTAVSTALAPIQAQVNDNIQSINSLQSGLLALRQKLDADNAQIRAEHEVDIQKLQSEIDNLQFTLPDFIDPESGVMENLQKILFNLYYNGFNTWISPNEFDALSITPNGFDPLNITAIEFDRSARTILQAAFGD